MLIMSMLPRSGSWRHSPAMGYRPIELKHIDIRHIGQRVYAPKPITLRVSAALMDVTRITAPMDHERMIPMEHESETPPQIITRVNELARDTRVLISLSGGNPALQPLAPVIALGRRHRHRFALETQGSVSQVWFADLEWLILSPKPPSSGMTTDRNALAECLEAAGAGRAACSRSSCSTIPITATPGRRRRAIRRCQFTCKSATQHR